MSNVRRLNALAIAREDDAAKGTGVAASTGHYFAVQNGILKPMAEYQKMEGAIGKIESGHEQHLTKQWMELAFSDTPVKLDWIGHFLTGILGGVSSSTVSGVEEHTIVVAESGDMPAYTLFQNDATQNDKATYGTVKKVEFNVEAGGLLTCDIEMIAQKREDGTGTPAYATDHHLQGSMLTVKFASATSGLGAANAIAFQTLRLTIERDVEPIFKFGDTEPNEFVGGALRISGEVTFLYEAETHRDTFLNDTEQAMLISFDDTATTIGSNTPSLIITLDKINIVNHERPDGIDEPDIETLTFEASFDLDEATPRMVVVVLTNEESATAYTEPA